VRQITKEIGKVLIGMKKLSLFSYDMILYTDNPKALMKMFEQMHIFRVHIQHTIVSFVFMQTL
jgi:hypothetical protein